MLLDGKNALIHGGGGALGGAVARALAREGARIFLAGRRQDPLKRVAAAITAAGGQADTATVDALDEDAVEALAERVVAVGGSIDIALNAVGVVHDQGTPFLDLSLTDYLCPIEAYTRTNFLTARAAARQMARRGSGVILTLSTPGSRLSGSGFLGYGVTCAAVEAFSRILAGELGPAGIRVICLRPDAIPEALAASHTRQVFDPVARRLGLTAEELLARRARTDTLLGRLPTLDQVADYAAFVASDRASAVTGAIVNLSCGSLVD